ncbi:MAG: Gldg family protein [Chloroflexota bacterium]
MTDQTPNSTNEPFIPPHYLLILSGLGFLAALIVALTQAEFGVLGYGGLAFGVLALLMWVLLAPQQARNAITGRTVRFGGTSLIVTIVLLVALIGIYAVVRNLNLRADLTQTDTFSLSDESRGAMTALAADPNAPNVKILAFYGISQAGTRDQATLLFDDYAETSGGKISYEFVDPDREPQTVGLYHVTSGGQIAVAKLNEAGEPDAANAEIVPSTNQQGLTNAILKASSSGVFNAYFLNVADGLGANMSILKQNLTDRYGWNIEDVSLLDLTRVGSEFNLNDPNVTGQVIIIPGGSAPLTDAELQILKDYVGAGGDLIILAGTNLNADQTSLATSDNLNTWLAQDFGVSFGKDVVIDGTQAFQTPLLPVAIDLDSSSFITTNGIPRGQSALVFEVPNSITLADSFPAGVTVTSLVRSSSTSYAKTDLQAVIDNNIDKAEGDAEGPFTLAASAENAATGAHVTLFGSTSLGDDNYSALQNSGVDNLGVTFNSLIWSTNFNDYFTQITVQQQQRPQDQPIFADTQDLRNINFITLLVLPFGVLAIGILVWWNNRERAR